jgi:UDP-N-acetylmuramoyl-L-alanyl-D-glutamate--2,6-diaminopimelate ligase
MAISKHIPQKIKNYAHYIDAQFNSALFGNPSNKLKIIGVTGTDGKTTTSTMLYEILKTAGKKVGLISTISAKISGQDYPIGFHVTTPNPKLLQQFLKRMVDEGLEYVVLETTSHGLDQHRVGGIQYCAAVYTNITHEHLDYHGTFEKYREAKMKLLDQTVKGGLCVVNKDDASWQVITKHAIAKKLQVVAYSQEILTENSTDKNELTSIKYEYPDYISETIFASNIKETNTGIEFNIMDMEIKLGLPGKYNVSNALAAISTALRLGIDISTCKVALENMEQLEGRWMVLQEKPVKVVVDFAHTPNALENLLQYAKTQVGSGKLWVVFGSAGLRDSTKRPLMGEAAGKHADYVVLTAEDNRTEKVEDINAQIISGINTVSEKKEGIDYFSIVDRREAIEFAIKSAKDGDLVVITGKGHEKSMNLDGKSEVHWDDVEVTRELLNQIR